MMNTLISMVKGFIYRYVYRRRYDKIVDISINTAIDDVLRYYDKKDTYLFRMLLVNVYRYHGKKLLRISSPKDQLKTIINYSKYLAECTCSSFKNDHMSKLYYQQMNMFYRRFRRICYNQVTEIHLSHIKQLIHKKLNSRIITMKDLDGASIGCFNYLHNNTNWMMKILDLMRSLTSRLENNIQIIIKEDNYHYCSNIITTISVMVSCMLTLIKNTSTNTTNLSNLHDYVDFMMRGYFRRFEMHLLTRDGRIIFLNSKSIIICDQQTKDTLRTISPTTISPGDSLTLLDMILLNRIVFKDIFRNFINETGFDIHVDTDSDETVENYNSNVTYVNLYGWKRLENRLSSCNRSIVYDGDLTKLCALISYYYDYKLQYIPIVKDVTSLL